MIPKKILNEINTYVSGCSDLSALTTFKKNLENTKKQRQSFPFLYAASMSLKSWILTLFTIQFLCFILLVIGLFYSPLKAIFLFPIYLILFIYSQLFIKRSCSYLKDKLNIQINNLTVIKGSSNAKAE